MKNFLIILILICTCFVSCDRRQSKSESLKASIEKFKKDQSETIIISYYPKEYTEVVTDTLLSNTVNIRIKNYSLAAESIAMSTGNSKSPKTQLQHRVFESDVIITRSSKELSNFHISASDFKLKNADSFWKQATLEHVWVNQELSTLEAIKLDVSFINPKDQSFKMFRISIDNNGHQTIDLIKEDRYI